MAITYGATPDKSIFPKTISGLTLWLDANDSSTLFDSDIGGNIVTNDGGAIGRWQDKSGNNRNFTQGAPYRPILKKSIQNNKNVIRFDGVDDAMYLSSTISSVGSFFLVFKNLSYKNYGVILNASTNFGFHSSIDGNYMYPSDFMTNENLNGSSITVPTFPTTTKLFDGVFKIFDTDTTGWNLQSLSTFTESVNGEYAEIIVYSSNLSEVNKNKIRNYLNNKWRIY